VLDVMLPDLDGLQVARALCDDDRTRSSAIVLLTGRAELPDEAPTVGGERVVYVTKPFDPSVLVAVVRDLVERRAGPERPREAVPGLSHVLGD
jgi:DNA-binding response OmpR family regulator